MTGDAVEFVERRNGEEAVLELVGSLDTATAPLLIERVNILIGHGVQKLRIDLQGVEFIDSRGIAALIRCRRRAHHAGVELELLPGEGTARRLLDATGLADVFSIEEDE
jgi:anti-sigma B factor antagonist